VLFHVYEINPKNLFDLVYVLEKETGEVVFECSRGLEYKAADLCDRLNTTPKEKYRVSFDVSDVSKEYIRRKRAQAHLL